MVRVGEKIVFRFKFADKSRNNGGKTMDAKDVTVTLFQRKMASTVD